MSNKIVKLKHTPNDPNTGKDGEPTLYHFEIDRKHYDTFDLELMTNPKNRKANYLLNSFSGKISEYTPPTITNGKVEKDGFWKEKELARESFHALIQTEEWGMIVTVAVNLLNSHYGGSSDIEDFLQ